MCTWAWVRQGSLASFITLVKIETSTGAPMRGRIDGFLTSATKMLFLRPHTVKRSFSACSTIISFISLHVTRVSRKKNKFPARDPYVSWIHKQNVRFVYSNRFSIFIGQQRLIAYIRENVSTENPYASSSDCTNSFSLQKYLKSKRAVSKANGSAILQMHSSRFASPELHLPKINVLVNIPFS